MRFAIIRFPGTWSDRDCYHVLHDVLEQHADILWHRRDGPVGLTMRLFSPAASPTATTCAAAPSPAFRP